ncbi:MAG: PLP-dependent aminotransferase family protein [Pseudomonadota bacterium]
MTDTEDSPRFTALRARLAEQWSQRSPKSVANAFSAPLFGTPGEWDLPADVTPKRELLYLAVGIPDVDSLPKQALAESAAAVLDEPGDVALRYGFGQGPRSMRAWIADRRAGEESDPQIDADWFQLTNGSAGAIDLVVRSLIDPGDVIIAESPTYMGTLHNFRGVGAEVRCVPIDDEGLDMDALQTLLRELTAAGKRVRVVYTISAFQNPSGATLSLARRMRLLELAHEHDFIVLDDEAYRDLWFDAPPPRALSALAGGHGVITVGTFSKTIATGIRVGFIHARPELLALFGRMRFAMGQNQFGLRTLGHYLERGLFDQHLGRVRGVYRRKRDLLHRAFLAEGLETYLDWRPPAGGFYLWATLRPQLGLEALWRTAVEEGIAVNNGAGFTPLGDSRQIRIAYPWTPEEQFPEAARRLRLACERVVAGQAA